MSGILIRALYENIRNARKIHSSKSVDYISDSHSNEELTIFITLLNMLFKKAVRKLILVLVVIEYIIQIEYRILKFSRLQMSLFFK